MVLKYRIISMDPNEHTVVVRFYSDAVTEEALAVHDGSGFVPRDSDEKPQRCRSDYNFLIPFPAPEDIHSFIAERAPVDWFVHMEKMMDPATDKSMSTIKPHLHKEFVVQKRGGMPIAIPSENNLQHIGPIKIK